MDIRTELRAPKLDADRVDRLTALCHEIVARVAGGQAAAELIYAFNRDTARVFGPTTFRGVYGGEGCEDFVGRILTPIPDPLPEISDAEAEEMVERIQSGEVDDRESWYWVRLLAAHYDQPRFSDLIYWPSRDLRPEEVIRAARLDDEELDEYLDPAAWGRHDEASGEAPAAGRRTARRLLQEMSRLEMLEVVDGEAAIDVLAPILAQRMPRDREASAVAEALMEPFLTSEVWAGPQQIADLLYDVRAEVN